MTAKLCPMIPAEFVEAQNSDKFFGKDGMNTIRRIWEVREFFTAKNPDKSCESNLFFGFFFDGTKNNYREDERTNGFSNIAHLYDCYPGNGVRYVLPESSDWQHEIEKYSHFFKVYIPGVASPFGHVNDTGAGNDLTLGAAMGWLGERRIIWALVQAINNVHRFILKEALVGPDELKKIFPKITLDKKARSLMVGPNPALRRNDRHIGEITSDGAARVQFEVLLKRLHAVSSNHWPDKKTGKPKKIDPAIIKNIYISIFGFSRGATQARAFTNWLQSLCKLDAQLAGRGADMSLGGFNVQFDFLGIFDTVASVGGGNTLGNAPVGTYLDGHGAWADAEDSLRIPCGLKCLHLVAAHEIRRSFPVDSISVGGSVAGQCEELVLPGAHSDVGGGYCPREQGKGSDLLGSDMMSRIPLLLMYKSARLSGVPFKLELANEIARKRFAVDPRVIQHFNAYLSNCIEKQGPLHRLMREHARKYIEWRLLRRIAGKESLQRIGSFSRASNFHQNDLHSAAVEFEEELKRFAGWLGEKGKKFVPQAQKMGFGNEVEAEWEEIARWWGKPSSLSPEAVRFFDDYVHDSRASFKLLGPDSESKQHEELREWLRRKKIASDINSAHSAMGGGGLGVDMGINIAVSDGLNTVQRRAVDEYSTTKKIPRMVNSGREPWKAPVYAGYLRYRKVYGGADNVLLSSASKHSTLIEQIADFDSSSDGALV
ncbi:T6SS phospholipase effector Tle1-like catalytic domain-containing protein [Massilia consociata]|uniref:T6SS phospholipase effector Tle1-like catalytic domain-containing protein n=1 Tax=Massilia consociata TaxID=760117 RepID=A0ABV6FIE0_9BURK